MPTRPKARVRRPAPVSDVLKGLGDRLREARIAAGLSQAQLGSPHFTRAYVSAIAAIVRERPRALGVLRKYMRGADAKTLDSAYEVYLNGLDRAPIPSDRAIQNTLDLSYRIAPKLAGMDVKKVLYFGAIQRLKEEGFIDRLYK